MSAAWRNVHAVHFIGKFILIDSMITDGVVILSIFGTVILVKLTSIFNIN